MRESERLRLRERYPDPGTDPVERLRHVVDMHSDVDGGEWAVRASWGVYDDTTGLTYGDLRKLAEILGTATNAAQGPGHGPDLLGQAAASETARSPMFYCDLCAEDRSWPVTETRSDGPCDMCDHHTSCNHMPEPAKPVEKVFYRVFSYDADGADTRRHHKAMLRASAETECRGLVKNGGRQGAYAMRYPDTRIVYHFDQMDLETG